MDDRRVALEQWAIAEVHQKEGLNITAKMTTVSGDASFRRYFRLHHLGSSWIAVDAPAAQEDNPKFVEIAQDWQRHGIAVPKVIAHDFTQGFMLLEDFGSTQLWEPLHAESTDPQRIDGLYKRAMDLLLEIQSMPCQHLPPYDHALLISEMQLFTDWLCESLLKIPLSAPDKTLFANAFELLAEQALSQTPVTVHRDYHSRNLMVLDDNRLGVIDFQDAVAGPATYDLISLLRDCYVRWPEHKVEEWMAYYWEKARPLGVYLKEWQDFQKDTDLMGVQRHLKAAGIFARLSLRDGKDGFLADIPNTCQYIIEVSAKYPELAELHAWLRQHLLPKLSELSMPTPKHLEAENE